MSTETMRDKTEGEPSFRERAPSQMREEDSLVARWTGGVGLMAMILGAVGLFLNAAGRPSILIGPTLSTILIGLGICGLLYHAATTKEFQLRRTYGILGMGWLLAGCILFVTMAGRESALGMFAGGLVCLVLGLLFLMASVRFETDEFWHSRVVYAIGAIGVALAVLGLVGSSFVKREFLIPYGFVLALIGLGYLWAFVGLMGTSNEWGHRAGLGMGVLGSLVFLVAFGRSALPPLFYNFKWINQLPEGYLVPSGLLLMGLGLLYTGVSIALCSDHPLVVMVRRELAAFFFSPVAYMVLFALVIAAWYVFDFEYLPVLVDHERMGEMPLIEPIVRRFMFGLYPVIAMVGMVPFLTMRLLSEEQRTGTLEVLLTSPVNETGVVLSKFIAALLFFLTAWMPWVLFLAALRAIGGEPFDYRPLISFFIGLVCMGSGFIAMGLFFSSLTRNQIISAVLTLVGMLLLLALAITSWNVERMSPGSPWAVVLNHISFLQLWFESLNGALLPRYLLYHVSVTVVWLFLTVKVLEIRRWS